MVWLAVMVLMRRLGLNPGLSSRVLSREGLNMQGLTMGVMGDHMGFHLTEATVQSPSHTKQGCGEQAKNGGLLRALRSAIVKEFRNPSNGGKLFLGLMEGYTCSTGLWDRI